MDGVFLHIQFGGDIGNLASGNEHPPFAAFPECIPERPVSLEYHKPYSLAEAAMILANGNGKTVSKCKIAGCFSCGTVFTPHEICFDDTIYLCHRCMSPTVVPLPCRYEFPEDEIFLEKINDEVS